MNLASCVSLYNLEDKVKAFLYDVSKENIYFGSRGYVEYVYPLTEHFAVSLCTYNEYALKQSDDKQLLVNMLFDDLNELELYLLCKSSDGSFSTLRSKEYYPRDILGNAGYRYLKDKDNSEHNSYVFSLDGISNGLKYLCLIFEERPELMAASDSEPLLIQ